jgi:hypothetical protein
MTDRLLGLLGGAAIGVPDAAGVMIWLILTLVLLGPIFFLLQRMGVGSGQDRRKDSGDALDRMITATEEIPEALPAGHRMRR